MITSKDDNNATASLLGFAMANRDGLDRLKSDGDVDAVLSGKKEDAKKDKKDGEAKNTSAADKKEKKDKEKDGDKQNTKAQG